MIGDVLTEGILAVGVNAWQNLHRAVLLHKHCCLFVELGGVFRGPPVVHVAIRIEEAALVVETVGHLMTDHDADRTVVDSIVGIGIEERRLKDGGREADLVGGGIVVGIHSLRSHSPFGLVRRLAKLGKIVRHIPLAGCLEILVVALFRIDGEGAVVFPLVGISYLDGECCKLLLGTHLGGIAHPFKAGNVLAEGLLEVLYEREHLALAALGEVFLYIHLAHRFAEDAIGDLHCALPAGLLLLNACHLTAVELEVGGGKVIAHCAAGTVHQVGHEIILEHGEVGDCIVIAESLEERRFSHDELFLGLYAAGFEVCCERETGIGRNEFFRAHRVVEGDIVALLLAGPAVGGKHFFHEHGIVGLGLGILHTCQIKDGGEELAVAFLDGHVRGQQIVVAIAYSKTSLAKVEDLVVAVHEVLHHVGAEETAATAVVHTSKGACEFLLVGNCI